jgi:SET domain-containing protein
VNEEALVSVYGEFALKELCISRKTVRDDDGVIPGLDKPHNSQLSAAEIKIVCSCACALCGIQIVLKY